MLTLQFFILMDQTWSRIISNPNVDCIVMVYLDFAKGFDKVDHHILLHRLKQFGIAKQSFLTDHKQFVQIPGGISTFGLV